MFKSILFIALAILALPLKGEDAQVSINIYRDKIKVKYQFDLAEPYLNELKRFGISQAKFFPRLRRYEYNVDFFRINDTMCSQTNAGSDHAYWIAEYDSKIGVCKLECSHYVVVTEDALYKMVCSATISGPQAAHCFDYQITVQMQRDKDRLYFAIMPESIICNQKVKTFIFSNPQPKEE